MAFLLYLFNRYTMRFNEKMIFFYKIKITLIFYITLKDNYPTKILYKHMKKIKLYFIYLFA